MKLAPQPAALLFLLVLAPGLGMGQFRSARQADRDAAPNWEINEHFKNDVFTFVRIKYASEGGGGYRRRGGWATDFPDSDLNLSFRLQQMTSLKVDPDPKILEITDSELFNYPWIYIVEPGNLRFTEEEVPILRRYLLSGGFLMVDDFWGQAEWRNFHGEIKRVFPEREREPVDLEMDHAIFHCVFDLKETKNKLQVPNIYQGVQSQYSGVTWERSDAQEVHFRAIYDDKGRMMVMICHNTDNGDGWEREAESEYYFREFSEKKAYPLGINIVFYAMTH